MKKQVKKNYTFSVVIEQDENGIYVGRVPSLRSCYTQAKTLPELYKRLEEVVALCVQVEKKYFSGDIEQLKFVGAQSLNFAV